MKRFLFFVFIPVVCFVSFQSVSAQIPTDVLVQIVRAEDERRFDATLENLLKNPDAKIRERTALAAGRIGDERAIPALVNVLKDTSVEVQTTAMFALGEIESPKASDAILSIFENRYELPKKSEKLLGQTFEAAGKIVSANPKDTKSDQLKKAIFNSLSFEIRKRSAPLRETILSGVTAVLRARPEKGEELMRLCLSFNDARIRADALNTLIRLRVKNFGDEALNLLQKDTDPIVRANAARLLAISEKDFPAEYLLEPAMFDKDSRVRVSAIRALATLKNPMTADKLLVRTQTLFAEYQNSKIRFANPPEKS